MRVLETVKKRVLREVTVKDETFCDKCGVDVKKGVDTYDAYECEVRIKTGNNYPEGGTGEECTVDLCKKCSNGFLQLLEDNGYKVNEKDWDW